MSFYGEKKLVLDTLAKQYVPALNQEYRYHPNRKILEFDDGTEYTLEEAVILARGGADEDAQRAVHLVKRVFDGVLVTERQERDFLLFGGNDEKEDHGPCVAPGVAGQDHGEVQGSKKTAHDRDKRGRAVEKPGEGHGPDSVPLLFL